MSVNAHCAGDSSDSSSSTDSSSIGANSSSSSSCDSRAKKKRTKKAKKKKRKKDKKRKLIKKKKEAAISIANNKSEINNLKENENKVIDTIATPKVKEREVKEINNPNNCVPQPENQTRSFASMTKGL